MSSAAAVKQEVMGFLFVVNFKRKWQAQTACASQYPVPDCGRVY